MAGSVWAAFAAGAAVSVDLLLRTKGDTRLWGQISFTPVLSEIDGTVENHVSLMDGSSGAWLVAHFVQVLRAESGTALQCGSAFVYSESL